MNFMKKMLRLPLPLWWIRLPLYLATLGLSVVCIAVAVQAVRGISHLEHKAESNAMQMGLMNFRFDMQDIMSTSAVLLVVALLMAISSMTFSVMLARDTVSELRTSRTHVSKDGSRTIPVSTRTLRMQALTLAFLTTWMFSVLIPSTVFSRTRGAKVTMGGIMISPGMSPTDPVYWDYGFLRCLAAAPWFTFVFSFPATIASIAAWKVSKVARSFEMEKGGNKEQE